MVGLGLWGLRRLKQIGRAKTIDIDNLDAEAGSQEEVGLSCIG
jgi:hypothetical protein